MWNENDVKLDMNLKYATTLKPLTGEENNIDHLVTIKCSDGKPWIHIPVDVTLTWTIHLNTASQAAFTEGSATPSTGQRLLPHYNSNCLGKARGKGQRAQGANLASKLPRSQYNRESMGNAGTRLKTATLHWEMSYIRPPPTEKQNQNPKYFVGPRRGIWYDVDGLH